MAATAANVTDAIDTTANTVLNINMANVTKLSSSNYLMWSLQVHSLLDGYGLAGHLDGSKPAPAATITTNNVVSENPLFLLWKRQDRLIYSGLIGAITTSLQPVVSRATTASEIWETLSSTYAKPSRGHIKQLKTQLKQWTKGNKSVDEYLRGVTTRLDQLAILGKAMDHEDQIDLILEGLPDEYKSIVDQIEGRDTPPSITELHERLLNHEAKLLSNGITPSFPASANVAQQRSSTNTHYNRNNRNQNRNNHHHVGNDAAWQSPQSSPRPNQSFGRPYQGRCQICSVHGHSARRCPQLSAMTSQVAPQPHSPFTPWQPQPRANLAVGSPYTASNWLVDSGATHHITSDLSNLSLHQPYTGSDDVLIGDGSALAISHTGSTHLPSLSKDLLLHKVLYVPNIHKNLISVYRLCNTNQVSVEFFPAHFQVKDLSTGALLLQGRTKDELYKWPVSQSQAKTMFASPTAKSTLASWHSRLGHPSPPILNAIISKFSLPVSSSSSKTLFSLTHPSFLLVLYIICSPMFGHLP